MPSSPWQRGNPPEPPRQRPPFGAPVESSQAAARSTQIGPPSGPSGSAMPKSGRREEGPRRPRNSSRLSRRSIWISLAALSVTAIGAASLFAIRGSRETSARGSGPTKPVPTTLAAGGAIPNSKWDQVARSVVYIEATGPQCSWSGSGSIVLDGSYVLTNHHVSGSGECNLAAFLTSSTSEAPTEGYSAVLVVYDDVNDLAVLRIFDNQGNPFRDSTRPALKVNSTTLALGTTIYTLGYPAAGGSTITFTSGDFSGMDDVEGTFYKTTAYMNSGVSGGAALNDVGELIGVPTAGKIDPNTKESLGINLIRPISYATELLARAQSKDVSSSSAGAVSPQFEQSSSGSGNSEASSGGDPIFGSCREAKNNGYGPYYEGLDEEYDFYDDRDGDGVVCE